MAEWEDFYETLGVGPEASPDAMRHAYREKVRAFHPDRLAGVADELRDLAEEQLKAVIRAYEVLRVAEHKRRYDVEWRRRNTPPKPVVEPTHIRFSDVAAGETCTGSFVIRNAGGSYRRISVSNPDSWLKVTGYNSLTDADDLPLKVEIEATGDNSDKQYKETIVVRLDRVHTTITVELHTRPPWGVTDQRSVSTPVQTSTQIPTPTRTPRSTSTPTASRVGGPTGPRKDAVAKNSEGLGLLTAGDYEGAIAAFGEAIALEPDWETVYRNRAEAHRRLGWKGPAAADAQRADSIRERRRLKQSARTARASAPTAAPTRAARSDLSAEVQKDLGWGTVCVILGVGLARSCANDGSAPISVIVIAFLIPGAYGLYRLLRGLTGLIDHSRD